MHTNTKQNFIYQNQAKEIKEKLGDKPYRIGLDLGVGSIGFAIVSMEENADKILLPKDIIMAGSRIFQSSDGAAERRASRGQRNNHRHTRERMRYLWKLLAQQKLALPIPADLERKENSSELETSSKRFPKEILQSDVYELRAKSLDEKLSLPQLGYVLYHIAGHRGSSAIRTFENDSEETQKENTENKKIAGEVKRLMKDKNYRTYGEYLYKNFLANKEKHMRSKVSNTKNAHKFSPTRDLTVKEVELILKKQAEFHPLLTKEYSDDLIKAIMYESEKLIPESGYCPYFKNEKRLPASHKLNEERRLWEALNNARYSEAVLNFNTGEITSYEQKEFNPEEKKKLFDYLISGNDLTQAQTKKLLNLKNTDNEDIILQGRDVKTQKIKGYKLHKLENMPFWQRLSEQQQDQFLYDWNSSPDEKVLTEKLLKEYHLSDDEIDLAFNEIVLSSAYAPIGKSAMLIVLEKIKNGLSYTEAIDEALKEGKLTKDKQAIKDNLPYYGAILPESTQKIIAKGFSQQFKDRNYKTPSTNKDELEYGRIANPVVHQTLNELRKLVNEIIEITGKKPCEIGLETARELKKSAEERKSLSKKQNDNENNRNRIYETYIKPQQQLIVSRNENPKNYILKFELLEEQKGQCPFCSEQINPYDILNNRADIEHLFPIAESEDNTRNNLVIAHSHCNQDKAKRSPWSAFSAAAKDSKYDYNRMLSNIKENIPHKAWRFNQGSFEKFLENKPMAARFKTDNSYISKVAHKYLSCLFEKPNIICVKGSLTAQLRMAWGLQGLMIPFAKQLVSEKDLEALNKDVNSNKKIRLDNRHHTLDAIVIAYASRGYGNLLNSLTAKGYKVNYSERNWLSKILLPPNNLVAKDIESNLKTFELSVKQAINNAFISIKHDHDSNGELVKGTMYKIFGSDKGYTLMTYKKLSGLKLIDKKKTPKEMLETALLKFEGREDELKNEKIRVAVNNNKNLYNTIESNLDRAKALLEAENAQAISEGKKEKIINDASIYKKAISLSDDTYIQLLKKEPAKFFAISKPTATTTGYGYDTGDSLCLDLYHDKKGKLCGEIIRKIDALQNKPLNYKQQGFQLFERVYGGDILEVDFDPVSEKKSFRNKTGSAPKDRVFIKIGTFTEIANNNIRIWFGNIIKSVDMQEDSFSLNSMQEYKPRKIILSSCGLIKYRSRILTNKEG